MKVTHKVCDICGRDEVLDEKDPLCNMKWAPFELRWGVFIVASDSFNCDVCADCVEINSDGESLLSKLLAKKIVETVGIKHLRAMKESEKTP